MELTKEQIEAIDIVKSITPATNEKPAATVEAKVETNVAPTGVEIAEAILSKIKPSEAKAETKVAAKVEAKQETEVDVKEQLKALETKLNTEITELKSGVAKRDGIINDFNNFFSQGGETKKAKEVISDDDLFKNFIT